MRVKNTDISPDGARIVVDWDEFTPGSSIFIPCLKTAEAVAQVKDASGLQKEQLTWRVCVTDGKYGVRFWRLK